MARIQAVSGAREGPRLAAPVPGWREWLRKTRDSRTGSERKTRTAAAAARTTGREARQRNYVQPKTLSRFIGSLFRAACPFRFCCPYHLPRPSLALAALKSRKAEAQPIPWSRSGSSVLNVRRSSAQQNQIAALALIGEMSRSYFTGIRWWNSERLFVCVLPSRGRAVLCLPRLRGRASQANRCNKPRRQGIEGIHAARGRESHVLCVPGAQAISRHTRRYWGLRSGSPLSSQRRYTQGLTRCSRSSAVRPLSGRSAEWSRHLAN